MQRKIFSTVLILFSAVTLMSTLTGWIEKHTFSDRGGVDDGGIIPPATISAAVKKSLLVLQTGTYAFTAKSDLKCASCHHTTLTSMAVEQAERKGLSVIDSLSMPRKMSMMFSLKFAWNDNMPDQFITAKFLGPYMLLGLNAEKYPPSPVSDVAVDYILNQARPDGSFVTEASRAPMESGEAHLVALSIRAIQLYAAPARKERVDAVVRNSRFWLEQYQTSVQQELVFQLLGLQWSGAGKDNKMEVAQKLLSMQQADGGWSQLPTLSSDAYATGQALYALYESGMIQSADDVYQRGLGYLLKTQDESGAWIVETRSCAIQPFFNGDFPPHDENQFISAAGTGWASLALLNALPDKAK